MSEITGYTRRRRHQARSRRASREIQRGHLGTQIATSRVGNATDVTLAKLWDVTYATDIDDGCAP